MTKLRKGSGVVTADPVDVKRIKRELCEQLHAHKFDNLNEIDLFLERQELPREKAEPR